MKGFLLSIFVICAVFATAYSLKCYSCTGSQEVCLQMEGGEGLGTTEIPVASKTPCKYHVDCDGVCMRSWRKMKYDGKTMVVNSCTSDISCKNMQQECGNSKQNDDIEACAVTCGVSDMCNAVSSTSISVFLMTVCSVLGLALLK